MRIKKKKKKKKRKKKEFSISRCLYKWGIINNLILTIIYAMENAYENNKCV